MDLEQNSCVPTIANTFLNIAEIHVEMILPRNRLIVELNALVTSILQKRMPTKGVYRQLVFDLLLFYFSESRTIEIFITKKIYLTIMCGRIMVLIKFNNKLWGWNLNTWAKEFFTWWDDEAPSLISNGGRAEHNVRHIIE